MSDEYSEYNSHFQLRLLALLVRHPEKALGLIEPHYFTHPIYAEIARVATDAYRGKDLETVRLQRASLSALVWRELTESHSSDAYGLKPSYMRGVREVFQIDLADGEIVLDEARKYAKKSAFREALIKAERDINAGNFDAVRQRFEVAARMDSQNNLGPTLRVYPVHRFTRQEKLASDPADYLIHPILPRGGAALLYGLPKELKSWMVAAMAVDAASGRKALGYFEVPNPVRTLYVQVEDPVFLTQERLKELCGGQGTKSPIGMLNVIPRCPLNLMDPAWLASLTTTMRKYKIELLVLDVFRRLFRGNVADSNETAEFLRKLDELRDSLGCAVLLVHHAKKSKTSEIQAQALGSVNLTAWADVLIYTDGKRRMGSASVADLYIEAKTAMLDQERLVLTVDSEAMPMVRVWNEGEHDLSRLQQVIAENPGLNQKELEQESGLPEKKLRRLLRQGVEKRMWRVKRGSRKELRYYPATES